MFAFPPEFAPLVVYLVTQGIKAIFKSISGAGSMIVAAFVGALLFFGEGVINSTFPQAAPAVLAFVNLALVVFAGFGTHDAVKYHLGRAAPKA
jgi:hypothetical protein